MAETRSSLYALKPLIDRWPAVRKPEGHVSFKTKLLWTTWHQRLGELAADVAGADATLAGPDYDLTDTQRLFLFSRAETIFGGSNEIQRNIVAERGLGLPRG